MGKISLLPAQPVSGKNALDISNHSMPTFYMEDYSVLALLVSPFQQAVKILRENGFQVNRRRFKAEIFFGGAADLRKIFTVFQTGGIDFGMSDIVDSVYQG